MAFAEEKWAHTASYSRPQGQEGPQENATPFICKMWERLPAPPVTAVRMAAASGLGHEPVYEPQSCRRSPSLPTEAACPQQQDPPVPRGDASPCNNAEWAEWDFCANLLLSISAESAKKALHFCLVHKYLSHGHEKLVFLQIGGAASTYTNVGSSPPKTIIVGQRQQCKLSK